MRLAAESCGQIWLPCLMISTMVWWYVTICRPPYLHYQQCSSKATTCHKIGPTPWKIGSTFFLRMRCFFLAQAEKFCREHWLSVQYLSKGIPALIKWFTIPCDPTRNQTRDTGLKGQYTNWIGQFAGEVMTSFNYVVAPTWGNWFQTNALEHEHD